MGDAKVYPVYPASPLKQLPGFRAPGNTHKNDMENHGQPWKTHHFYSSFSSIHGISIIMTRGYCANLHFFGPPIQFPTRWSWPKRTRHEFALPPNSSALNFRVPQAASARATNLEPQTRSINHWSQANKSLNVGQMWDRYYMILYSTTGSSFSYDFVEIPRELTSGPHPPPCPVPQFHPHRGQTQEEKRTRHGEVATFFGGIFTGSA